MLSFQNSQKLMFFHLEIADILFNSCFSSISGPGYGTGPVMDGYGMSMGMGRVPPVIFLVSRNQMSIQIKVRITLMQNIF